MSCIKCQIKENEEYCKEHGYRHIEIMAEDLKHTLIYAVKPHITMDKLLQNRNLATVVGCYKIGDKVHTCKEGL